MEFVAEITAHCIDVNEAKNENEQREKTHTHTMKTKTTFESE